MTFTRMSCSTSTPPTVLKHTLVYEILPSVFIAAVPASCRLAVFIALIRLWAGESLGWSLVAVKLETAIIYVACWMLDNCLGGWNSSVGSASGSLSCMLQRRGFDPPLGRKFPVEGIFPLELAWVLTPFPKNSFGWEYKPRSSLCTHAFHRTDWKDPDVHILDGWMPVTKTHPACTIHEDGMWLLQWLD